MSVNEKEVRLQQITVRQGKLQRKVEANHRLITLAIHKGGEAPQSLIDENNTCRDELGRLGEEKQKLLGVGLYAK
jgi:hypothetical protein